MDIGNKQETNAGSPVSLVIDADGRIEAADASAELLLGTPQTKIVGTRLTEQLAPPSQGLVRGMLRLLGSQTPTWSTVWFRAPMGVIRCLVRIVPTQHRNRPVLRLELGSVRRSGGGSMTPPTLAVI